MHTLVISVQSMNEILVYNQDSYTFQHIKERHKVIRTKPSNLSELILDRDPTYKRHLLYTKTNERPIRLRLKNVPQGSTQWG